MSVEDAARWDNRYQNEERYASFVHPRQLLVDHAGYLPSRGLGLDAAMGLGGNAGFLLERGLNVIGVDVSGVAVQRAKNLFPDLWAVQADLLHFCLPEAAFDVILNFFYLQRELWPAYKRAITPGGLLFFETMTLEMRTKNPEIDSEYLLAEGELRQAFSDFEMIYYREGWTKSRGDHLRPVASMVARKPGTGKPQGK